MPQKISNPQMTTDNIFSLAIHGGAGLITDHVEYKIALTDILTKGERMLHVGASALDTVEMCVCALEDNPIFNAGRGSVLNEQGVVELDASIMDGNNMMSGAVAAVTNIKNPVSLARLVMDKSDHVLLVGNGAMEFARTHNVPTERDSYFITEARTRQWQDAQTSNHITLDHSIKHTNGVERKLGTVGAVARDLFGNLAAATSTGGLVNKKFGRVGDTPIIGAGVFADNETCAVSCTGVGEHILRVNLAKTVSDYMRMKNVNVAEAAEKTIEYFTQRVNGVGGFIAIGNNGEVVCQFTTPNMIYGFVSSKHSITVQFDTT